MEKSIKTHRFKNRRQTNPLLKSMSKECHTTVLQIDFRPIPITHFSKEHVCNSHNNMQTRCASFYCASSVAYSVTSTLIIFMYKTSFSFIT